MPTVSVVLCAHNEEKYIGACVDSVLNQTFTDFELLVIDDRSADRTPEILAAYHDPRMRVIRNDQPRKLYDLADMGIRQTSGEFIARMDADDINEPERFAAEVEYLRRHPEVVAVSCVPLMVDQDNQPLPPENRWNEVRRHTERTVHDDQGPLIWQGDMWVVNGASMFRRKSYLDIGGYDSQMKLGDRDFFMRVCQLGRIAIVDRVLYRWRHDKKNNAKWNRLYDLQTLLPLVWKQSQYREMDPNGRFADQINEHIKSMGREKEYWRQTAIAATNIDSRLREVLADCRARGEKRVALYGAGEHTHWLLRQPAWSEPDAPRPVAIFDDQPGKGETIVGVPVVAADELRLLQVDALVISSGRHEYDLFRRAKYQLRFPGVRLVLFYGRPEFE